MKPVPPEFAAGPFARHEALAHGLTPKMLRGRRFTRLHPRVFVAGSHELTWEDRVEAARLALPGRVHLTGISRLHACGPEYGPRIPVRFVIEGDHHLAIDGIFLHRTKKLPPLDEHGVSVEAAYLFYCAQARVVDAIKVGDWLLHLGHMDVRVLRSLAVAELWRPGANEALWVLDHLDGNSWSLLESETRSLLTFAGLPRPECNKRLELGGGASHVTPDLLYRHLGVAIEVEGGHHQTDRGQYVSDIDRYEQYRTYRTRYVQVTVERLRRPRQLVARVHRELCDAGYDGPPPRFGERWLTLFAQVSLVLGSRRPGER